MKNSEHNANSAASVPLSEVDALFDQLTPLIKFCMKKFPSFCRKYYYEMYDSAAVGILQSYPSYDAAKGEYTFFIKPILGALMNFVAKDIYGFSSVGKFKEFCKLKKLFEAKDTITENDIEEVSRQTGHSVTFIKNTLEDFYVGAPVLTSPKEIPAYDVAYSETLAPTDNFESEEMENAVRTAMTILTSEELEFVYDLCGFEDREILSESEMQKKYHMTAKQYTVYKDNLMRKLRSSKTLKHYYRENLVQPSSALIQPMFRRQGNELFS